jgi:segregation and condensation protein A
MLNIKINAFEGPLGLLLQLIEREEMDITQVSLAKIADQYISHITASDNIDPEEMADFLVVASRLLLIKSKALLPFIYPEEEEEIKDLEAQLKMYKEFLEAMKKIEAIIGKKKFMFPREFNRKAVLANLNLFSPPKNLTAEYMRMVFADLLGRVKLPEKLDEEKLERKINIEEKILAIQKMLIERIKFGFSKILKNAQSKTEIIVSFLAMLELAKQRNIAIDQVGLFEEIMISKM